MPREKVERREVDQDTLDEFVQDIVQALPKDLREKLEFKDKASLSQKEAQNLVARIFLGMFESRTGIYAVARAMLEDPVNLAKFGVALVPKNVTVEQDVKVQHTIIVPEMQSVEQWMADRNLKGSTMDELGFEHATIEVSDDDQ